MTNMDSILKTWHITLPTKVHLVKTMVCPVVMYGCESWTIKKAECLRIDAYEVWCWRRLLRVSWTARRSNQSILKEISPRCSLEEVKWSEGRSVVFDSLWPHELQHARPPCPSPTPRVHSNSHPSILWCHPAISSSVIPFSPSTNPS